jgi:hypothetical protein
MDLGSKNGAVSAHLVRLKPDTTDELEVSLKPDTTDKKIDVMRSG